MKMLKDTLIEELHTLKTDRKSEMYMRVRERLWMRGNWWGVFAK